jgi:hypothetical protein
MKPCPECGEPPHYHSFCTLCAQLFMAKPEQEIRRKLPKWHGHHEAMVLAVRLAFSQRLTEQEAATKLGCRRSTIARWRILIGLPSFKRKSYGRRSHALAP